MIVRATSADAPSGVWNAAHCNAGAVVQISIGANTQGLLTRGQQIRVRGFVGFGLEHQSIGRCAIRSIAVGDGPGIFLR